MPNNSSAIYSAPVKDILFVMNELAGLSEIISYPRYSSLGKDISTISRILDRAANIKQKAGANKTDYSHELPRLVTTACNEIAGGDEILSSSACNLALVERIYQMCVHHTGGDIAGRLSHDSSGDANKLFIMRSYSESLRALGYYSASLHDSVTSTSNSHIVGVNRAIYEFLSPISQGFSIELAIEVASLGAQIHKRWNYAPEIELSKISEKDVTVWVNDLILQKTLKDGGAVARVLIRKIEKTEADLDDSGSVNAIFILKYLAMGRKVFEDSLNSLLGASASESNIGSARGKAYLQICGHVLAGWQMARAALAAERLHKQDSDFYEKKIRTARFFMANLLPRTQSLLTLMAHEV
jgi:hypothetical protein